MRERRGDMPLLLQYFLNKFAQPGKPPSTISPRAWAVLSQYHFPGNVREFAHAIEHAVVLAGGGEIEVEHLPGGITGTLDGGVSTPAGSLRSLSAALKEFEHEYLMRALAQANGKKMKAAEILGISRKNLWEKLRLHGIASEAEAEQDSHRHDSSFCERPDEHASSARRARRPGPGPSSPGSGPAPADRAGETTACGRSSSRRSRSAVRRSTA